ncbi:MAG: Cu(I)-responsive transcriptional regulator [Lautropia sp.]
MQTMTIGEAAQRSGVSAKMIRHYEEAGLVSPGRRNSGYRHYLPSEVQTLRFIRHARDLGFSIRQISELVGLWQDRKRPSKLVKALAQAQIIALEEKTRELMAMRASLEHLVECCRGDDRPDCPILDSLSDDDPLLASEWTAGAGKRTRINGRVRPRSNAV